MTIFSSDLKLVHAIEDSQFDTGGGALSNREIEDGNIGELIDPIDEVSASLGRVMLYKGGAVVDTNTQDRLRNAFLFLSETPSDELVSVLLFSTADPFDRLPAIRSYVQSYYEPSTPTPAYFYQNQASGLRSLIMFQSPNTLLPRVGTTMAVITDKGLNTEVGEFVVVESVSSELLTVSVGDGNVTKQLVTLQLQDRLANDYYGDYIAKNDPYNPRSKLYNTYVTARAKYYGMTTTTAELASGDNVLHVAAIDGQLVPVSSTTQSHVDLRAIGDDATLVQAANANTVVNSARALAAGVVFYTGVPIYPGTLAVTAGTASLHDLNGILYAGSTAVGTVNYQAGSFQGGLNCPSYGGTTDFSFRPAAVFEAPYQTHAVKVESTSQFTDYSLTLPSQPEPGTLRIYYRAQGVDYLLQDRGDGVCVGADTSFGQAQLRFETRSVQVSLETLPDVGSYLFYAWGTKGYVFNRSNVALGKAYFEITTQAALPPNGFTISVLYDGQTLTGTDDGAGNLVGTAFTGRVYYSEKRLRIEPNVFPTNGIEVVVSITPRLAAVETFTTLTMDQNGQVELQLAHTNLIAGSARLEFTSVFDVSYYSPTPITPEQNVNQSQPLSASGIDFYIFRETAGSIFGGLDSAINHATGAVTFNPEWQQPMFVRQLTAIGGFFRYIFTGYTTETHTLRGTACKISYYYGDASTTVEETFSPSVLVVDLTPGYRETVLFGSVSFQLGRLRIVDQDGHLYSDVDDETGAGTLIGSLDPTGRALLTAWPTTDVNAPELYSITTQVGACIVDEVTFRAPSAPVSASGLQFNTVDEDGNIITATALGDGTIADDGIKGFFNYAAGIGTVQFGDWVTASEHTTHPAYNAAHVVNGLWFKPRQVIASANRFNCRTINYLPVDSNILKLDSRQLPRTGRVPFIQKGDWLLIHHTLETTASSATAGGTVDSGRTTLEKMWVRDSTGKKVPDDRYTMNLTTGILTWAAPLSLSGYSAPFTIYNRKMHRSRCFYVDISGRVDLDFAPDWDIPAGAKVSTGMIVGDLQGRITGSFTVGTWDSVHPWPTSTPNTTPLAVYNALQYPILVSNRSTSDRYALIFTDSTHFKIESKGRGELARDISTGSDYTLVNSDTSEDEFTVYHAGWGTGWIAGNVLYFDVVGGKAVWDLALTVQPGNHSITVDRLTLEFAGGV